MTKDSSRVIVVHNEEEVVTTEPQKEEIVKWEIKEGTIPNRWNNPLSVTCGRSQQIWIDKGLAKKRPLEDGRCFMWYIDTKTGFKAAQKLISSPNYALHSVENAMRKWSSNGYGNEFDIKNHKIKDLSSEELESLIQQMAKREGFKQSK